MQLVPVLQRALGTSGMMPPRCQVSPCGRGPARRRPQQPRGKEACCSGHKGRSLSQGCLVLVPPLRGTGSSGAGPSDALALTQFLFPTQGGERWPRDKGNSLGKKLISLRCLGMPMFWKVTGEYNSQTGETTLEKLPWEPGLLRFSWGLSDPDPLYFMSQLIRVIITAPPVCSPLCGRRCYNCFPFVISNPVISAPIQRAVESIHKRYLAGDK